MNAGVPNANILRHGSAEPPPERTPLRAGPLSLIYQAGDLRSIRWGGREILRRVTVAVRDRNWGTVPAALSNIEMDAGANTFRIAYDAQHRRDEIDFAWRGTIQGDAAGTIRFTMTGAARSTFLRNRIGFCVLHPIPACAGARCRLTHTDGSTEESAFPTQIAPHQPFLDLRALAHEVAPGVWAEVVFTGEIFETEDQRNWIDASYKTYGTPLRLPNPVEIREGTFVSQSITLRLIGDRPLTPARAEKRASGPVLSLGEATSLPLPRIGLGAASHGEALGERELVRLRALHLSHLRVDLAPGDPNDPSVPARAAASAAALDVPLEIALLVSGTASEATEAISRLRPGTMRQSPCVARWLLLSADPLQTLDRGLIAALRPVLHEIAPDAPVFGGTNAYFAELNRARPPVESLDGVCYSANPQVHAFDDASLIETLEGLAATVESARGFRAGAQAHLGDLPLALTPITLKPRFNPNATGPPPEPAPGALPRQGTLPPQGTLPSPVDPRQMSLLGAGWTLGVIARLARGGVASATIYETTGRRGVMETEHGSPPSDLFPSWPGCVFPIYHVLADVGEFAHGGEIIQITASEPFLEGLALRGNGETRVLLANLSAEEQTVTVRNLGGERACVRLLDETNAEAAMDAPEAFRARRGEEREAPGGSLTLRLLPNALARIDG